MKKNKQQLEFDRDKLINKRFTLGLLVESKLNKLAIHLDQLTHSDVVWLSRVEDFFHLYEYLTPRQIEVIDSIFKRHSISNVS